MTDSPPTICKCGLAKSYHNGSVRPDHPYEPRYEPEAWREGYRVAMRSLPSPAPEPPPRSNFIEWTRQALLDSGFTVPSLASETQRKIEKLAQRIETAVERERAAQPAPDPSETRRERVAWGLLNRWLGWARPHDGIREDAWKRLQDETRDWLQLEEAAAEVRPFLSKSEARESGGEP